MSKPLHGSQKIILIITITVFFLFVFLLLFSMNMQKKLDHDEHQFIASGKVFSSKQLIPYKNFPYFHMPNLVFIYAAVFSLSDNLLVSARFFSIICAFSSLGLIFCIAFKLLHRHHYFIRIIIGVA